MGTLAGMSTIERIASFRRDLPQRTVSDLVQRHITYGGCFALTDEEYFALKTKISSRFQVHLSEIVVVGSAKLGFSIVPDKRYRAFGERSDIDVAICSSALFDVFWQDVFEFWARGEVWEGLSDFRSYLFRGWMRPDKLPPARTFARGREWWEFFRELTNSGTFGPYKITGALYKSWRFLETYQSKCIGDCKQSELDLQ
jgi:hypothetical protein